MKGCVRGQVGHTVRNFGDEVGDEEGGGNVGEVVADELEVFGYSHYSSVLPSALALGLPFISSSLGGTHVDHNLVDELHGVAMSEVNNASSPGQRGRSPSKHDWHNAPVNLPSELDQINGLSLSIIRLIRVLIHIQVRLVKILLLGDNTMSVVSLRINIMMLSGVD